MASAKDMEALHRSEPGATASPQGTLRRARLTTIRLSAALTAAKPLVQRVTHSDRQHRPNGRDRPAVRL